MTLMLTAVACQDADDFDPAARARLVERQQHHLDDMRNAEATIRASNNPHTAAGRHRIKEAAANTEQAEAMLDFIENLQTGER